MNELGNLLRQLRGFKSLRTISEMTNNKISHAYLGTLEKGINPANNQPVKPSPETLKILSEVYNYPYEEFLILAGYLSNEQEEDKVNKLIEEFKKLSTKEKEKFLTMIGINKDYWKVVIFLLTYFSIMI